MKNSQFKISVFIVLFLLAFINVEAQQITNENTYLINQYFQNIKFNNAEVAEINLLNQQKINNNSIYNSEVSILQTGNYNSINVKANPKNLDISQIGNSNNYELITYYNSNKLNFEAQQVGNNNQLQVFGQNSIIDNMKILQFSNNKAVTITSF